MGVQRAVLASRTPEPELSKCPAAQELPDVLCGLLTSGGDNRLLVDPHTGSNIYGCVPFPAQDTHVFSSSTASSISAHAFAYVLHALEELFAECGRGDTDKVLRSRVEQSRATLRECLGLDGTNAEIVFSPSGTDAQLHALFLTSRCLGKPLTTITLGADQTGSGTAFTSKGQHFSPRTSRGYDVEKGAPIPGLSEEIDSFAISLIDAGGRPRDEDEIDAEVYAAVEKEVRAGRKVLLQAMDASKFGWRAPSDRGLETIRKAWPEAVQVVIDACQMRISRQRIKTYLARGYIILVTGSKFFTGPAFSGALLIPPHLFERANSSDMSVFGLEEYATQSDYPPSLEAVRSRLDGTSNLGQWLRWEAALQEMRRYYALPFYYRQTALARLAREIPGLIARSEHLEHLTAPSAASLSLFDDEEMASPTIFPFLIKSHGTYLGPADAARVYRALMSDVPDAIPPGASPEERRLAKTACHVGQPVNLPSPQGAPTAALRICVGARTLSQMCAVGGGSRGDFVEGVVERVRTVVQKTDLVIRHLERLAARDLPGGNDLPRVTTCERTA